jgi:hypothetical protein
MGKCGVCLAMVLVALVGCGDDGGTTGGAGAGGGAAGGGAGMGMAGGGPPPVGVKPGCSAAAVGMAPAALHQGALDAIAATMGPKASCATSTSCHKNAKAMLMLAGVTNLNMTMVGKASCEAPNVPLVDARGGDAALANSWLWIKLVAPDTGGGIALNPAWGTPGPCGIMMPGTAGSRMPMGQFGDAYVGDEQLAAIRNWICAGAPGP